MPNYIFSKKHFTIKTPENLRVREADSGTRTRDLLITNQLLYQLSHISVTE